MWVLEVEFKSNINITGQTTTEKDVYFINIMEIYDCNRSNHIWKGVCPYMVTSGAWMSSSGKVWYCDTPQKIVATES